jgi:hypothetical protein
VLLVINARVGVYIPIKERAMRNLEIIKSEFWHILQREIAARKAKK